MQKRVISLAVAYLLLVASAPSSIAAGPSWSDITFGPSEVDVSSGSASISISATFTDTSGTNIDGVSVSVYKIGSPSNVSLQGFTGQILRTDSPKNASLSTVTFRGTLTVPARQYPGNYGIRLMGISNRDGLILNYWNENASIRDTYGSSYNTGILVRRDGKLELGSGVLRTPAFSSGSLGLRSYIGNSWELTSIYRSYLVDREMVATSTTPSICSITGTTLRFIAEGPCYYRIMFKGDSTWSETSEDMVVDVTPAPTPTPTPIGISLTTTSVNSTVPGSALTASVNLNYVANSLANSAVVQTIFKSVPSGVSAPLITNGSGTVSPSSLTSRVQFQLNPTFTPIFPGTYILTLIATFPGFPELTRTADITYSVLSSTPSPTPTPTPSPTPTPDPFVYEQVTPVEQQACQIIVKRMNSNLIKLSKFEVLFPNDQLINSFKSRWKLTSNVYTQANCKFENLTNAWKVDRNYENALNDDFLLLLDQLDAKKSELDDKASILNKEMNETFNALTNNINRYKNDISQLFRDYPAYFNQTPELRSSLQRVIDYKIPTAASQSGIDAMRELIGGGSGSALASDFLLAQAGITKYISLEKIKAKTAKKSTITCVKGKQTKKVTATNPKCPAGYKKK